MVESVSLSLHNMTSLKHYALRNRYDMATFNIEDFKFGIKWLGSFLVDATMLRNV